MDKHTPSSEELVEMMVTSWRKGGQADARGPAEKPGADAAQVAAPRAPGQEVRREFYAGDAWSLWARYASRGIILDKST